VKKIRGAMRSVVRAAISKWAMPARWILLASGLLILGLWALHQAAAAHHRCLEKVYTGTVTLGAITPSYDLETTRYRWNPGNTWMRATIRSAFAGFVGEIMQRPPIYSAKRFEGERAYWLARDEDRANLVEMPPLPACCIALEITFHPRGRCHFEVHREQGHLHTFLGARYRPGAWVWGLFERLAPHAIGPTTWKMRTAPAWAQRHRPAPRPEP
jgi:hypothetical protein